jgi:DNA repair exonuclease SbcCD ATPase subunit
MSNSNDMSVMVPSESSRRQALLEVRDGLSSCVQKLKSTSEAMTHIESQGRVSAFLNKSNNIREIATHVGDLTDVQQQTLKMLVLLMGGIIRVKQDFNEVMDTIELLSNENSGHAVVLDYLLKLKKTVAELKRRDEAVEVLSQVAGETEQRVALLDANLREAGQIASHAMTSLRTHIEQVAQNMTQLTADQGRLNENIDLLASEKKTLEDSVEQQVKAYSTEALIRMAQLEDADKISARKVRFLHRQGKRLRRGLIWLASAVTILAIVEGISIFAMLWRR